MTSQPFLVIVIRSPGTMDNLYPNVHGVIMSEDQNLEVPSVDEVAAQVSEPQVPETPLSFTPPPGYVLVPEGVYNMMINQAQTPVVVQTPTKEEKTPLLLSVLRQMHLGDIKTNIGPGDQISFVPQESITIRGRKYHNLDSFLSVWNKQNPDSPRYKPQFAPVFSLDNPQDYLIYHPASFRGPQAQAVATPAPVEDQQRISQEESQHPGAAQLPQFSQAPTPTQQQIDAVGVQAHHPPQGAQTFSPQTPADVASMAGSQPYQGAGNQQQVQVPVQQPAQLPPRGSAERKALIVAAGGNPQLANRIAGGIEIQQPQAGGKVVESPDQFAVHGVQGQQRTVAGVPGPPAEAAEVIEMQRARSGQSQAVRSQAPMADIRTPSNMGDIT